MGLLFLPPFRTVVIFSTHSKHTNCWKTTAPVKFNCPQTRPMSCASTLTLLVSGTPRPARSPPAQIPLHSMPSRLPSSHPWLTLKPDPTSITTIRSVPVSKIILYHLHAMALLHGKLSKFRTLLGQSTHARCNRPDPHPSQPRIPPPRKPPNSSSSFFVFIFRFSSPDPGPHGPSKQANPPVLYPLNLPYISYKGRSYTPLSPTYLADLNGRFRIVIASASIASKVF